MRTRQAIGRAMAVVLLVGAAGCRQTLPATCPYVNDGECDDGRLGAHTNQCAAGTDEDDCANVDPTICQTTEDGVCDDGRPGADFAICAPGTDEVDCGTAGVAAAGKSG